MENDKTEISIETLQKIADLYQISLIDLISSEIVSIKNNSSHENSSFQGGIIHNNGSKELFDAIKQENQDLRERIAELKDLIQEKNLRIQKLEDKLK